MAAADGSVTAAAVRIEVLGRFCVAADDVLVEEGDWPSRRSAELVQLLALSERRQLLRDEVCDALWPHLSPDAAANNLRKAAHHARQVLGEADAVVLRGGTVALFPDREVLVDVDAFEVAGGDALAAADPEECAAAADSCGGELLPVARYEDWAEHRRRSVRALRLDLLRAAGRWADVVALEPTDEPAHQELMEAALRRGSRAEALRWYAALRRSLASELGVAPDDRSRTLHERCLASGSRSDAVACIGRDAELAVLEGAMRSAADRRGGAVVVHGGAGSGKTTICQELGELATEAGWRCFWATADGGAQPYGPLLPLLEELLVDDRDVLPQLAGNAAAVLGALVPGLGGRPTEGPLSRHQVVGAVQQLLRAVAGGPAVLVVDDAHLADEATIDVVGHIAASVRDVVVVLARRDAPANASLAKVLRRLDRAGRCHELELRPLGDRQADELLRAVAPHLAEPTRLRLRDEAAGNPFILVELARIAGQDADAVATVGAAMTARLADLAEADVDGLRRLALGGGDLDQSTALALFAGPEPELHDLLDTALDAGVLVVVGDRYRFAHELVRSALAGQLPPHRRLEVHRRAAAALADSGAAPAAVARHWLAGERPAEAVDPSLAAAERAVALGAFADARRHVEPVLAHDPANASALRIEAQSLDMMGDPRALRAYDAAIAAAEPVTAHDLMAMRALAQIKQGDPAGGLEAIAGASPTSVVGRLSEALTYAGAAALGFADPAFGTAKAAESRRLALQTGDTASIVIASWAQAAAAHARGELHDSVLADLRDTAHVPHLAVRVFDGHLCMTQRFLYGARPYDEVIAFADALADEALRLGAMRGHAFAMNLRGEAELHAGRIDDAAGDLAEGARLHRAIGGAVGEAHALQRLAEVAHHRGRPLEAAQILDEALDLARVTDIGFHLLDRIYGTRVTLAGSDPEAALAAVDEAESAVQGQLETCPGCRITFAVPAAIACATAGELDRALRYEEASAWLAQVVMRLPAWHAAHEEVRGHVRLAAGDPGLAKQHFARAVSGFAAAGHPLDAERCRSLASAG
ncbi:AAA family ATPase [Acidimicrobiia bacterium EGI L10123]|uniref:ATP-binding protein n=1 Tax=Salinilacustrithrix flava TaxID=2957203 RepID=UPI003D7C23A6|nr:AAA family ATPase [Acidimicrobiia bacterium EGI L10123]